MKRMANNINVGLKGSLILIVGKYYIFVMSEAVRKALRDVLALVIQLIFGLHLIVELLLQLVKLFLQLLR